jgi:hypothetical protein
MMETDTKNVKEDIKKEIVPEISKNYVYPVKDWKEYLGESLLIVFSVLFALFLTEYFNKLHDRENTRNILRNVTDELTNNKKAIQAMLEYNLNVLNKIDSVLADKRLMDEIVVNDQFHLDKIAPMGVQFGDLDNEAWTIAINNNIMSKINVETITILSKVYEDQTKILKVEDEVAKVIFDRESRDPKKIHETLIVIKDIYRGWAVDRMPLVLSRIDIAIGKIKSIKI